VPSKQLLEVVWVAPCKVSGVTYVTSGMVRSSTQRVHMVGNSFF